jgi:hypothetical protein
MNDKEWREQVLLRDNYICQRCFRKKKSLKSLHAHHIKTKKEFPKLIYNLKNGITLCHSCHTEIHYWATAMNLYPYSFNYLMYKIINLNDMFFKTRIMVEKNKPFLKIKKRKSSPIYSKILNLIEYQKNNEVIETMEN